MRGRSSTPAHFSIGEARLAHPNTPDHPEQISPSPGGVEQCVEGRVSRDEQDELAPPELVKKKWPATERRGILIRFAALLCLATPLSLLVVARLLSPSQQGLGTHQQLGLPPCSMRVMFGIRCPGCGMTTSWSHFTRGQWMQSLQSNVGGFLFAIVALIVIWLSARTLNSGQLPSYRTQQWFTYLLLGVIAITLLEWIGRLVS